MPSQPIARPPSHVGQVNPSRSAALDLDSSNDVTQTRSGPSSSLGSNNQLLPRPLLSLSCSTLKPSLHTPPDRGTRSSHLPFVSVGPWPHCFLPLPRPGLIPSGPHGLTASAHAIARHHLARQLGAGTKRTERKVLQDQAPSLHCALVSSGEVQSWAPSARSNYLMRHRPG
jgi:hypothetical protein